MTTKYYKCKLLTDVVLNSSLATEGNMQSLDYIPGSNFLGIVAEKYKDFGADAYDIFHSGKVSFGDALISKNEKVSYSVPFSLFTEKLKNNILTDRVWVHHGIKNSFIKENGYKLQLKQVRSGFINADKNYFSGVEKEFALKSAYDADERRSKESAMFGFDAIKKEQEFIFSVIYEEDKYIEQVEEQLLGVRFIGKSKTAQFGMVNISKINEVRTVENGTIKNDQLVIYAESNLCFLNENGQATFQPDVKEFGINGTINWAKSQIRTYSYSPWNNTRNTSNTQRDVILKGSVLVIDLEDSIDVNSLPKQVGEFNAEGLGRIIYNPEFLEYETGGKWIWEKELTAQNNIQTTNNTRELKKVEANKLNTSLGKILAKRNNYELWEKELGERVVEEMQSSESKKLDSNITKTQWGAIREKALQAQNIEKLMDLLFKKDEGYLMHGVAAERIWDKNRGAKREALKQIIIRNKKLGNIFVAKFASEMAKKVNK